MKLIIQIAGDRW